MKDLKIRVNSEAESKEAQELFFELGYKWFSGGNQVQHLKQSCSSSFGYLVAWSSGCFTDVIQCGCGNEDAKKITLPELRDLVVLKRNNVGDANVIDPEYDASLYLDSKGDLFVFPLPAQKWKESNLNGEEDVMARLKPIEKPMKEYLIKSGDGKYLLTHHDSIGAIEIPEGATKLVSHGYVHLPIMFVKPCANGHSYCYPSGIWSDTILSDIKGRDIFWSRHTHPEELPFIDDEPSINDQYAEIEKVRQSHRTASVIADPTIKETLNQRQSQYGSFEDVAMITEQMVDVMRKGYYENLAYNQKMALYMICSKMARIVNGNPNHKDSWHDIAGYATLIDNELVSEKDMPF